MSKHFIQMPQISRMTAAFRQRFDMGAKVLTPGPATDLTLNQMHAPSVSSSASPPGWNPALSALPDSGIRRMFNLAATLSDVIHLSIGQPDFPTPAPILEAYAEAVAQGRTRYTMDAGLPELLAAVAAYYEEACRLGLTEDNVLITCGASEALHLAITAVVTPGSEVIVIEPSFVNYQPLVRFAGGRVVRVTTRAEDGYLPAPTSILAALTERTRAVILNSPGNPTGTCLPRETVETVVEAARERGIFVISDEVYEKILLDGQPHAGVLSAGADLDHVFFISSVSKTWSMPGMRVGWVISSPDNIRALRRYHIFTTTVGNTPAQWAAVAALTGSQEEVARMTAEYRRRRDRVVELMKAIPPLTGYRPDGAFYIMPSLPEGTDGAEVAMRLLKEARVCVVPGETFGASCANALRISFATSMDNIEEAFERMTRWFGQQSF